MTRSNRSLKLVVVTAWLSLFGVALVAGSCSVNHRSDEFVFCNRPADCASGQVCSQGVCVASVDAGVGNDAKVTPDALVCPSQCTSCKPETMECKIDCAVSPATCNGHIVCPAGWNCDILCTGTGSCRNGVDCTPGESCAITCSGANSCRNLACGQGPCNVICSGSSSCRGVSCGQSCACDVDCQNAALCDFVQCSSPTCDFGNGCSTLFPTCNTCP
ncbi:MAG: hypothetical protein H6Q90_601 [Deltaproteobacteria bacterium]|nr:hypothetical protein [Deltaproteobacteria bacterium]